MFSPTAAMVMRSIRGVTATSVRSVPASPVRMGDFADVRSSGFVVGGSAGSAKAVWPESSMPAVPAPAVLSSFLREIGWSVEGIERSPLRGTGEFGGVMERGCGVEPKIYEY